jgi:hypothetical protein
MSKQDFIALADGLRAEKPGENWNPNKRVQWELDVKAVADVCAASNPRFKRDRWMSYVNGECGPNGGTLPKASKRHVKPISASQESLEVRDGN